MSLISVSPLLIFTALTLTVCSFEDVLCHNAFILYLALTSLGISVFLCSSVVPSVTS